MKYILILGLLFCEIHLSAQNSSSIKWSSSADNSIKELFKDYDNLESPGYAIGISKNGKTLFAGGFGAANLDYFVPELKQYDDTIRLKHLIYNTSGIHDYPDLKRESGKSWVTFNYFDIDECIRTSLAEAELQFKPGTQWDYCNVNFMLLAKVVEKVKPLGMNHTLINDDITSVIRNRVTPYNLRNQEYLEAYQAQGITLKQRGKYIQHPRNSPHFGGSGVVTTISDLLIWSENMVSMKFGGQEFYDLMHKTGNFEHDRDNQAFGLYFGDFNGKKIVAWDGGDYGISSQLLRFPDEGVAIVVLSNLGSGQAYRKVNAIADILTSEGILE